MYRTCVLVLILMFTCTCVQADVLYVCILTFTCTCVQADVPYMCTCVDTDVHVYLCSG